MQTITDKIVSRIYGHGRGWSFSKIDFADIGRAGTVDQALSRLHQRGTIRRVLPGLYDYPRFSQILNEQAVPDLQMVADALARKHRWKIVPDGPTALHVLGLSEQVPARYRYLSTGPNRVYDIMGRALTFLHRKTQHTALDDEKGALLVQGVGAVGAGKLSHTQKAHLSKLFKPEEFRRIVKVTASSTAWVHEYIQEIAALAQPKERRR